jgi:glutamyl-tRNA synthetase
MHVITTGQEVTLMDWGNAIIKEIRTENGIITQLVNWLVSSIFRDQ